MNRCFAADGRLVHDPATGLTHRAPQPQDTGRVVLGDAAVATWPVVAPADLTRLVPVSVCWSPIVRCNLRCPHCLDDTTVPELNAAGRRRIAAVLATSGVLGIDISGGEPLLLRDLPGLLAAIRDCGRCAVSVTTNGWHLARRAEDLAGIADAIRVSLDGPDSSPHDQIRGAGSFARACDGIRTAVAEGIPVQIQSVLMRRNASHAQDIITTAQSLGAGGVTFLQMLPFGAAARLAGEMVTDQDAQAMLEQLRVPAGMRVRLRTQQAAGGFTVVRADGRIWRNDPGARQIGRLHPLRNAGDLALTGKDGSA